MNIYYFTIFVTISIIIIHTIKNRTLDVRNIKKQNIEHIINRVASDIIKKSFFESEKLIRTQKGALRADFTKAVNNKKNEIVNICFSENAFNDDFCLYVNNNHCKITKKSLYKIITEYIFLQEKLAKLNLDNFINKNIAITPKEFLEIKKKQIGDIVGVYILYNKTKNIYYVGQAKRLFFRINQHLVGHGNGDIYADYKNGDDFTIQMIELSKSGYSDLDKLEKDLIKKYDSYNNGYNKTNGNN